MRKYIQMLKDGMIKGGLTAMVVALFPAVAQTQPDDPTGTGTGESVTSSQAGQSGANSSDEASRRGLPSQARPGEAAAISGAQGGGTAMGYSGASPYNIYSGSGSSLGGGTMGGTTSGGASSSGAIGGPTGGGASTAGISGGAGSGDGPGESEMIEEKSRAPR